MELKKYYIHGMSLLKFMFLLGSTGLLITFLYEFLK